MHSLWIRLNAVVFFALTVLLALAITCALSTYLHRGVPAVKTLRLNELESLRKHQGIDLGIFSFDLDADLRPAFHWNLHQLFVYVVAEYESSANPLNQVVVWDSIITQKEDAYLKDEDIRVKYALIDQGDELRGKNITLRLMWDHMPVTGRLYVGDETKSSFVLPAEYMSNKNKIQQLQNEKTSSSPSSSKSKKKKSKKSNKQY